MITPPFHSGTAVETAGNSSQIPAATAGACNTCGGVAYAMSELCSASNSLVTPSNNNVSPSRKIASSYRHCINAWSMCVMQFREYFNLVKDLRQQTLNPRVALQILRHVQKPLDLRHIGRNAHRRLASLIQASNVRACVYDRSHQAMSLLLAQWRRT